MTLGFRDLDNLLGALKKDAPTLPVEALFFMLQVAASKGWSIWSKDVEAAFLSGGYFGREIFVTVPRSGLPAIEELGWPAMPEGTVMGHKTHKSGIEDSGCMESRVAKAMYICKHYDEVTESFGLEGIVGTHVDDDLFTGSDWLIENIEPSIDEHFTYGEGQDRKLIHTGHRIEINGDGTTT